MVDGGRRPRSEARNLDFLSDVTLEVQVEVGRTEIPLGKLMQLRPGSVVVFDRSPDHSCEVRLNGKLIGRGEVIVVDEAYGVRITSIEDPEL